MTSISLETKDALLSTKTTKTTKTTQLIDGTPPDWSEFSVEKWRNAVFKSKTYFSQLYIDTNIFLLKYVDTIHTTTTFKPSVIEVGCGTGESLLPVARSGRVGACLGVDINPKFITFCNETKLITDDNILFFAEDAANLRSVLKTVWDEEDTGPKIVTCLGNTVGIMPVPVKDAILVEMAEVAGDDGIAIVVYWNGNYFGDALQNFYFKNPQLCGVFDGKNIDLKNRVLQTDSGYRTHWTTPEEATEEMSRLGLLIVEIKEQEKGVLVAFRKKH